MQGTPFSGEESRTDDPKFWPIRAREVLRLPPGALAILGLLTLLAAFWLSGALPQIGQPADPDRLRILGSALFFAVSFGLLMELSVHALRAAQSDLDALRPVLDIEAEQFARIRRALIRFPRRELLIGSTIGLVAGLGHAHLVGHGPVRLFVDGDAVVLLLTLFTVALWILMIQVALPLVGNAHIYSYLGQQRADICLYNIYRLYPFGRTALRPTLLLIGLQATYPLLMLGQGGLGTASLLGLAASLGLVVALFLLPLNGIRCRIAEERDRVVALIEGHLDKIWLDMANAKQDDAVDAHAKGANLLFLRDHLKTISSWPLGMDSVHRALFYLALGHYAFCKPISNRVVFPQRKFNLRAPCHVGWKSM